MGEVALKKRISDVIAEYEYKLEKLQEEINAFTSAGEQLQTASSISGTYGGKTIDVGHVYKADLERNLLCSAWRHVYNELHIKDVASAKDKNLFEQTLHNPPEFTKENIRASFGDYLLNPRQNILRGLAEVFCTLDDSYKSHDKVRIGVKGLPKRIIMGNLSNTYGWGVDRLQDVLNALAQIQGKPLTSWNEVRDLMDDENALLEDRGVRLVRYKNGNGHLIFDNQALKDINAALAEYYGEVLADCYTETGKPMSTAVSKDLQYYATPVDVVNRVLAELCIREGDKILEPSCGCGRFLDALKPYTKNVFGIEVDGGRVEQCREKGHTVMQANFLEVEPNPVYDRVIMNPPFYGRHYVKHIKHALKFLKDGGTLTSILPSTARYDHKEVDGWWSDLPVGSFSESGTNINTTVLTIRK